MIIHFCEEFKLPVEEVFSYFETPADWARLYGFAGSVKDLGSGWFSIPLKWFPFPLVAKNTEVNPCKFVHWTFRGFWRGEGEVRFAESDGLILIEGYEEIGIRGLFLLSTVIEKLFLERQFRAIWQLGWRHLRKREKK